MQTDPQMADAIDLRVFMAVLRRRKWSILLVATLILGLVMAYSFTRTPIYSATAVVQVKQLNSQQISGGAPLTYTISMDTEKAKVTGQDVVRAAAKQLDVPANSASDLQNLISHVSVGVDTDSTFLRITYSDPDPALAQRGADAFAAAYIADRAAYAQGVADTARKGPEQQLQDANRQIATLTKQLAKASAEGPTAASSLKVLNIGSLLTDARTTAQQAQLILLSVPQPTPDPASLALPATLPTSPSSPNIVRNGALGLILGLALGVGFAFLRERLDDRLSGREEFEEAIGAPVLAVVPKVQNWKKRENVELVTLRAPKSAPAEAYRTIRTNLQYAARGGDMRVIELTSFSLGEGKTTSTANLAVALAQAGKRVIAVSADLRKPRLHRFFGLENKVGITSLMAGEATLHEVVQRVPGLETVRLIASGPVPANPAEMLGSPEMAQLLTALRRVADFVLLDTAPVGAVSDALVLARESDGIIVVADAANATRSQLQHLREQLEQVGGKLIGGIFNNFDPATAKYGYYYRSYYSYRYQGYHGYAEAEPSPNGQKSSTESLQASQNIWT